MSPSFHGLDLTDEYRAFEELWARSSPVDMPQDWVGDEGLYLADFVQAVEIHLGLRQSPVVTIPIDNTDDTNPHDDINSTTEDEAT